MGRASCFWRLREKRCRCSRCLPVLQQHPIEHGEDGLLLGLGEARETLELALELGGGPALAGLRARDAATH